MWGGGSLKRGRALALSLHLKEMCWRGILADVTKGWKRDLHEAGDNKDEINGVSGLITSKEGERQREKKKRKQK